MLVAQNYFTSLKGVRDFCIFEFDKKYQLGEVRTYKHEEKKFKTHNLLKKGLHSEKILSDYIFVNLKEHLSPLEQPEMQSKKKWDLYKKVRPYVPSEYQDIVCPQPDIDEKTQA